MRRTARRGARTAMRAATPSAISLAPCRCAVPTLRSLGLARVVDIGGAQPAPIGAFGRMAERSPGKDSVTGHWEMAGLVLDRPFPTFPHGFAAGHHRRVRAPDRPARRSATPSRRARRSSTQLGPEHMRTGAPIVYTSADSVFQIAAHEDVVPIDEQYRICDDRLRSGRARARRRPRHRAAVRRRARAIHAHAEPPRLRARAVCADPARSRLEAPAMPVVGIGKIEDLFARRGLTRAVHTTLGRPRHGRARGGDGARRRAG